MTEIDRLWGIIDGSNRGFRAEDVMVSINGMPAPFMHSIGPPQYMYEVLRPAENIDVCLSIDATYATQDLTPFHNPTHSHSNA